MMEAEVKVPLRKTNGGPSGWRNCVLLHCIIILRVPHIFLPQLFLLELSLLILLLPLIPGGPDDVRGDVKDHIQAVWPLRQTAAAAVIGMMPLVVILPLT